MRRFLGCLAAVGAATTVFALATGQALAQNVECGDIVTQDTKLESDLNCAGDGLMIAGQDVTLDLNGHSITGQPTSVGIRSGDPTSESCEAGSHVAIRNGAIEGFGQGVAFSSAPEQADIALLSIRRNHIGVTSEHCTGITVRNSSITANSDGGISTAFVAFDLEGNEISHNGGEGFECGHGNGVIGRNSVIGNAGGGIFLNGNCRAEISDNRIGWNGGLGIAGDHSAIRRNRIVGNEGGGVVASSSEVIGNWISGNRAALELIGPGGYGMPGGGVLLFQMSRAIPQESSGRRW